MLGYNLTFHGYKYYVIFISVGTKIPKNPWENAQNSRVFEYFYTHTNENYIIFVPIESKIVA